jgi:hypothetical protein
LAEAALKVIAARLLCRDVGQLLKKLGGEASEYEGDRIPTADEQKIAVYPVSGPPNVAAK